MTLKKTLLELKKLLAKWGLGQDDWSLFLHYADILNGYNIKYERDSHLHVMVSIDQIPWLVSSKKINEEMPVPDNSEYSRDFNNFIKKTGWDFHILIGDAKYFKNFVENSTRLLNINRQKIRIATVIGNLKWGYVYFNQYAKKTSPEVMTRRMTWRQLIYNEALKKGDIQIAKEAKKLLIQFNSKEKKFLNNRKQASQTFKKFGWLKGQTAFPGQVRGIVFLIENPDQVVKKIKKDLILVSKLTSPKLVLQLKAAKAVITDEGGQLSHAAIFCREFKIPGVIGTFIATEVLKSGDLVEVDANKGVVRKI